MSNMLVLLILVVVELLIIGYIFRPEYTTCTQCGGKAKVDHRRDIWECQEECCMVDGKRYGKYLKY